MQGWALQPPRPTEEQAVLGQAGRSSLFRRHCSLGMGLTPFTIWAETPPPWEPGKSGVRSSGLILCF